jgi:hypothetical protein
VKTIGELQAENRENLRSYMRVKFTLIEGALQCKPVCCCPRCHALVVVLNGEVHDPETFWATELIKRLGSNWARQFPGEAFAFGPGSKYTCEIAISHECFRSDPE